MRRFAAIALALLPLAAAGAAPQHPTTGQAARGDGSRTVRPSFTDSMNLFQQGPGCLSIPRQVAGEDRRYPGTRLDREPPGRLILAVDRIVGGCHEVVLASDRRFGGR